MSIVDSIRRGRPRQLDDKACFDAWIERGTLEKAHRWLNENEFELWIEKYFDIKDNSEILERIYEFGQTNLSEEQMKMIGKDLMSGWRFEKE